MDKIGKLKKYGFTDAECHHYSNTREFNTEDYVSYIQTSSPHLSLKEPYKSKFYAAIRDIIMNAGDSATLIDDIVLHIAKKP